MSLNRLSGTRKLKRSQSFAGEMADVLRDEIERGVFRPGERLPTEHVLAETFGVSRSVVREAISVLKSDGLVESFQGRGIFVSETPPEAAFRLRQPNLDDKVELALILEFLIANEVAATSLAAERCLDSDLTKIRRALDAMARAVAIGEPGVDEDVAFHAAIIAATRNPFIIAFSNFLEHRVRNLIRTARTNTARFRGLAERVQAEHQAIYDAIAARDPAAARAAAETHLRNAAARLQLYRSLDPVEPSKIASEVPSSVEVDRGA
jgi:DNA-binding FadR family transcriptional regulator